MNETVPSDDFEAELAAFLAVETAAVEQKTESMGEQAARRGYLLGTYLEENPSYDALAHALDMFRIAEGRPMGNIDEMTAFARYIQEIDALVDLLDDETLTELAVEQRKFAAASHYYVKYENQARPLIAMIDVLNTRGTCVSELDEFDVFRTCLELNGRNPQREAVYQKVGLQVAGEFLAPSPDSRHARQESLTDQLNRVLGHRDANDKLAEHMVNAGISIAVACWELNEAEDIPREVLEERLDTETDEALYTIGSAMDEAGFGEAKVEMLTTIMHEISDRMNAALVEKYDNPIPE